MDSSTCILFFLEKPQNKIDLDLEFQQTKL